MIAPCAVRHGGPWPPTPPVAPTARRSPHAGHPLLVATGRLLQAVHSLNPVVLRPLRRPPSLPAGCAVQLPWAKKSRRGDPLDTKYPYVCHAEMNAILNKNGASGARGRVAHAASWRWLGGCSLSCMAGSRQLRPRPAAVCSCLPPR